MKVKLSKKTIRKIVLGVLATPILIAAVIWGFSPNQQVGNSISATDNVEQIRTVGADTFATEIQEQDSVIIDIRTPEEYAAGRIEGSINIDYYADTFAAELAKLDKNVSYKVYCNSGNRSESVLEIMKGLGFTKVTELDGGIQAWLQGGNPTCTAC